MTLMIIVSDCITLHQEFLQHMKFWLFEINRLSLGPMLTTGYLYVVAMIHELNKPLRNYMVIATDYTKHLTSIL
jgi:glycosyltransferase A (GT-A) superfamily protein (DUF2064 family)